MTSTFRRAGALGLSALVVVGLAACSSTTNTDSGAAGDVDWSTVTSAEDGGGMDALISAAQAEGALNAIALPNDWANYGEVISTFEEKYDIEVTVENPDGSSQDELNAVSSRKGQDRSPDVIDVGSGFDVSAAKQGLLAPYQVASFDKIPESQKDPEGLWVNDMGGYQSIGCDTSRVDDCPKTFADLLDPKYKGQVALTGSPTTGASPFGSVYAAALANGGSLDDIEPGIEFFGKLHAAGSFNPVEATPATMEKGETPIVITWDYLNASYADELSGKGIDWQISVPEDGIFAQYYSQAVVKWAPHPAAARLWQEFLYSPEGQNLWLKGYARPVLLPSMVEDGSAEQEHVDRLPAVPKTMETFPTQEQSEAAKSVVADGWTKAVS